MWNQDKIYCVGDSHAQFFLGRDKMTKDGDPMRGLIPFFEVHHVGAALAYNLNKTGSSSQGREHLFAILKTLPRSASVLLSFGEIDCRSHVIRIMKEKSVSMASVVEGIVKNYLVAINEVSQLGFRVIVWGLPPSARDEVPISPDYPAIGTCIERNQAIILFEKFLQEGLMDTSIRFVSIFDRFIDARNTTQSFCHYDGVHLSQSAMPLALRALHRIGALRLRCVIFYFLVILPMVSGPYNLSIKIWRCFFRPILKPLRERD